MGNDQLNERNTSDGKNKRINEICSNSNRYVVFEDIEKIRKSICKIKPNNDLENNSGTGFFIDYNSNKYLITNYHVISKEKKKIEIEIWDKSNIKLDLNNRYIIYLPEPKDITIISLKNNEIDKIEYLFFDLNYSIGYNYYNDKEILSAGYPKGKKLAANLNLKNY